MGNQKKIKIELLKKVCRRMCERDITFLTACPPFYVFLLLLSLFTPSPFPSDVLAEYGPCPIMIHNLLSVGQTTQNDVSIRFSTGSIEEHITMLIDVSENMMEYFFKNVNYVTVF